MTTFRDFPVPPEGHPDAKITRSYLGGKDPVLHSH